MSKKSQHTNNIGKVHLKIKLEYLFWAIEKIIFNLEKFTNIISQFKIELDFRNYNFLEELYNKIIVNETYKMNGKTYKNEANQTVIFVFYPLIETDSDGRSTNTMKDIINILKVLFDDKYNIGCNIDKFPRFNFKINNSIYFALGDSNQKQDNLLELIKNPEHNSLFTSPTDANSEKCITLNLEECEKYNLINKKTHNREICKLNDDKTQCVPNDLYQHNLLLKKGMNFTLLETYAMFEQEGEYNRLINE